MQDKEFDKIFNQKFEDFEAEPSAMAWDNIANGLDSKKAKRSVVPYLSIAASAIIVLTAGILFLQQKSKPTIGHKNQTKLVASHMESKNTANPTEKKKAEPIIVKKSVDKIASIVNHHHKNIPPVNKIAAPVITKPAITIKEVERVKADSRQLIAVIADPASTNVKAAVPDVQLAPKSADMNIQTPVEKVAITASSEKEETTPDKKRGIHNLGGLINALIAKVDKRQDKLIEFSDSDDDDAESNVTGVNLGVIKIKKQ